MKKITVVLAGLLLLAAFAAPALAQETPVDEVEPIVIERPLPAVDDPDDEVAPVVVEPAVVPADRLAVTGLELTTGMALAAGLVLAGAGTLFVARRRRA